MGLLGGNDENCVDWEAWYRDHKNEIQFRILERVAKELEQGKLLLQVTLNKEESKEWKAFTSGLRYITKSDDNYLYTQAGKTKIILTEE